MSQATEALTFTVSLALSAHRAAEKFRLNQCNPRKAKQIYQNTLAVYAVNFYLQCLGIETDLEKSDSWNPAMQTLMDVADLDVKNLGKLECISVLPNTPVLDIPPEVWEDRIGYVAVQLNESLREATLLGFVKTAAGKFPLGQLLSLEDLPEHLRGIKALTKANAFDRVLVNLKQWFEGIFEEDWQPVELVMASSFRTAIRPSNPKYDASEGSVNRAKVIDLGMQLADRTLALVVKLTPTATEEVDIRLRLYPGSGSYLPPGLKLMVLDEFETVCMETCSRNADNWIQLEFSAAIGEQFNVTIALGDVSIIEKFVV